ncbi:MAG TPA: hypothetical protein VLF88_02960 [Candidatus Babeliales bacterium]|nr:hypothetical protein [Candidatus Babeliales bacterium]
MSGDWYEGPPLSPSPEGKKHLKQERARRRALSNFKSREAEIQRRLDQAERELTSIVKWLIAILVIGVLFFIALLGLVVWYVLQVVHQVVHLLIVLLG